MTPILETKDLTMQFGGLTAVDNINFKVNPGEIVALIGPNGAGKTTFFNCITGKESFQGRIMVSDIKISLMEQEQSFSNLNKTFDEYLKDKENKLEERKNKLEERIGSPENYEDEDEFNSLMDEYNLLLADSSFDTEQIRTKKILDELGMTQDFLDQKIKSLSGGQKTKLRLAECLSKKANFYLLDEPTNNLDLPTREWLENYLNKNVESLMVISHDRYFLNRVVDKVLELENQQIREWSYPFVKYLEKKKDYIEVLERKYKDAKKKQKQLLESAEEKRRWAAKNGSPKLKRLADRLERDAKQ